MKKRNFILWLWFFASLLAFLGCGNNGDGKNFVKIYYPEDGSEIEKGNLVAFRGTGCMPMTWTSSIDGQIGEKGSFTTDSLSIGKHTITLFADCLNDYEKQDSITITISPSSAVAEPEIIIKSPKDGSVFKENDVITFSSLVTDVDEGILAGDSIVWESSIDGEIGKGDLFITKDLSPGIHTITLTATNISNVSSKLSVTITVLELVVKNADKYKKKQA
ncbi:MAG: hypothetical protein HQK76_13415 [Desulfobacterales bacterium]|nr:hypothetical protein [Desulfobacterales bacterium]